MEPTPFSFCARPGSPYSSLWDIDLVQVILYGDEKPPIDLNKELLEATLKLLHATERF